MDDILRPSRNIIKDVFGVVSSRMPWVVQLVGRLTLDFGSDHNLKVLGSVPPRLHVGGGRGLLQDSLFLPEPLPQLAHILSLFLK